MRIHFAVNKVIGLFFAVILLGSVACRKAELNRKTTASESQALAGRLFANLCAVSFESAHLVNLQEEGVGERYFLGECASIIIEEHLNSGAPQNYTIDFSADDCQGHDLGIRSGRLFIIQPGNVLEPGGQLLVRLENYALDGYRMSGNVTILNRGLDADGHPGFDVAVYDGQVVTPEEKFITWDAIYRWRQIAGSATEVVNEGIAGATDDQFLIFGSAEGLDEDNRNYSSETTNPLLYKTDCNQIVSGEEEVRPDGLENHELHYGQGDCDTRAKVTIDGDDRQIELR